MVCSVVQKAASVMVTVYSPDASAETVAVAALFDQLNWNGAVPPPGVNWMLPVAASAQSG
jgi:hypothetical protein